MKKSVCHPFRTAWQRFRAASHTLPTEVRDYPEWHRGRRRYAVWVVQITEASVQARAAAARAHLTEFLLSPYHRQPHISIFVCGFPSDDPVYTDDYPAARMSGHINAIQATRPRAFEIEIGAINSFVSAPFLEVIDVAGGIQAIRRMLARTCPEIRMSPYVPHLTLGLYASAFDTRRITAKINTFKSERPLHCRIHEIQLATYRASQIAGPLYIEHAFSLDT